MHIHQDDLWLCDDCTLAACNDDYTGLDYHYAPEEAARRMEDIKAGLARLGPHLVPDGDGQSTTMEFSRSECDCCGTTLAGRRTKFAALAPDPIDNEEERFLPLGSLSAGVLHPSDMITRYLAALERVNPYTASEIARQALSDLANALENHAPPYTRFGAHKGNGADHGVWIGVSIDDERIQEAIHDGDLIQVADLSEVPDDYEGDVLVTNDHGNRSLYCAEKRSPRGEREFRVFWEAV